MKEQLKISIDTMLKRKHAIIPQTILKPLFLFMRYTLIGAAHLNKYASGLDNADPILEPLPEASRKRKRIIERLALGLTPAKKRKFPLSRVKEALRADDPNSIEEQACILESHGVVVRPTSRSVELVRSLSARVRRYMFASCALSYAQIASVEEKAAELIDKEH